MLRPRRVLSSPLKLVVLLATLLVLYYLAPDLVSRVQDSREGGAPPNPRAGGVQAAVDSSRGRVKIPNGAPGAAQRAQFDLDAERRQFAEARAREREQERQRQQQREKAGRKPLPDQDDEDEDDDDPAARMGGGAERWAAADEARRRAQKERDERERGRDPLADRQREMDRLRAARPPKAVEEQPPPRRGPWVQQQRQRQQQQQQQQQQNAAAPNRPPPPPDDAVPAPAPLPIAKEPQRALADADAPGRKYKNTYEEEIEALANRRARQGAKLRDWDDGRGHGDDDMDQDDLDGVQKGVAAQRGAAAAGRKKGPLIQVGGARNAAGDDKGGRAAPAKDRADTDRVVKGWDQRFRRPAPPLAKGGEAGVGPRDSVDDEMESPPYVRDASADTEMRSDTEDEIAQHYLVRRIAAHQFVSTPAPSYDERSDLEDSLRASAIDSAEESASGRYNLTVCAFIPHEKRFLGEWLLYHRLLGVERFALYDTSHPGVFGAAEIDELIDKMKGESGEGELAPTIEELKAHVGTANSDLGGLDERGEIRKEKIAGFERWIDQGTAKVIWANFGNAREARDPHAAMLEHCVEAFASSSEWLAQLDVDEFLTLAPSESVADAPSHDSGTLSYPLLDLLATPELDSAACVPLPLLNFRNYGIRELRTQGLLETQVRRDVIKASKTGVDATRKHQRILLHTACAQEPTVTFSGAHSCLVSPNNDDVSTSMRTAIKTSAGELLQEGGRYEAVSIPTEPLAVAHYVQRDLRDCFAKLSSLADPNDLHPRSRGMLSCEEHYIPTPEELEALPYNEQNRFLLKSPSSDQIVLDRRVADSWAARATREIRQRWQAARDRLPGRGKGQGGDHDDVPRDVVDRARRKVQVVDLKRRPRRVVPDETV